MIVSFDYLSKIFADTATNRSRTNINAPSDTMKLPNNQYKNCPVSDHD